MAAAQSAPGSGRRASGRGWLVGRAVPCSCCTAASPAVPPRHTHGCCGSKGEITLAARRKPAAAASAAAAAKRAHAAPHCSRTATVSRPRAAVPTLTPHAPTRPPPTQVLLCCQQHHRRPVHHHRRGAPGLQPHHPNPNPDAHGASARHRRARRRCRRARARVWLRLPFRGAALAHGAAAGGGGRVFPRAGAAALHCVCVVVCYAVCIAGVRGAAALAQVRADQPAAALATLHWARRMQRCSSTNCHLLPPNNPSTTYLNTSLFQTAGRHERGHQDHHHHHDQELGRAVSGWRLQGATAS